MTEKYNGYSNRETWACNLWFNNDEGLYREWYRLSQEAQDVFDLADKFKGNFEEIAPYMKREILDDIGFQWRINWEEIARSWIGEK